LYCADGLLDRLLATEILHGDKGYDSDAVRRKIESKGLRPTSRPKSIDAGRTVSHPGSIVTATPSNACSVPQRLSPDRHRYDRLASNFLAAVCLAATLCYWL